MEKEVRYLEQLVSEGRRRINPERIQGIMQHPQPRTKKELRKVLGLNGYSRFWIEAYAQTTKLYLKLLEENLNALNWTEEEKEIEEQLKQDLMTAPVLALPALKKSFHPFITASEGAALGVLTEKWDEKRKPVAYLSKLLDAVYRDWRVYSGSGNNCLTGGREQERINHWGAMECFYPSPSEDHPYSESRKVADRL